MKPIVLISALVLFTATMASGQGAVLSERQPKCDTITEKQFNRIVKGKYKLIKKDYDASINEMIILVRIYNTLQFARSYKYSSKFRNLYKDRFKEVYIDKAVGLLECQPSQGNWYSKKYDLFITSGYHMKCDNYYFLK